MEFIFEVGGFGLRWYSALIATGLAVGAWIATIEARRRGEQPDHVFNIVLLALPLALIGARAYHVIDQWGPLYSHDPARIFLINEGGIGIYGAVAGSILAMFLYTRWSLGIRWSAVMPSFSLSRRGLSFARWMDIGAPGLIIGPAIGRWGNFFNQELYGTPSTLPWALDIPFDKRLQGYETFETFHPLFLYESLLNFMAFGAMMYLGRRLSHRLHDGDIALMYGVFYGSVRLSLEGLRIGNWTYGDVPVATVISALAIVGCGGALLYRHWWAPRKRRAAQAASGTAE